jgi:hypothetical protein
MATNFVQIVTTSAKKISLTEFCYFCTLLDKNGLLSSFENFSYVHLTLETTLNSQVE